MLFCCVDRHRGLLVVRSLFVNNKEGGLCFAVIEISCAVRVSVSPLFSSYFQVYRAEEGSIIAFFRGDPVSVFGKI